MAGKHKVRNIAAIGLTSILIGACGSGLGGGSQPDSIEEEVAARVAATKTAQVRQSESVVATHVPPTAAPTSEPPSIAMEPPVTNVTYPGWDGECVLWDKVTLQNVGETLCVYGEALRRFETETLPFIAHFSDEPGTFIIVDRMMPDTEVHIDDCVMVVGEVESMTSVMRPVIYAAGQLRFCEIPSGNAAAPTEPPRPTPAMPATPTTPSQLPTRHPYHDAFDRQFSSADILLWSLIEGAPEDWWEPKSEFETQAKYNDRMQDAEQDFLQASNEYFGEVEDLIYIIYAPGEGNRIPGTSRNYDGMVLHPYDPEHNRYEIDIRGRIFTVDSPITLNWDVASLPEGIDFIDDIDYFDILVKDEENHFDTWMYPDVIRLHAQIPPDVAQQIRELDVEDNVTVRFFVQFDFPNNLRSYAWEYSSNRNWFERPVEPEPGAVVATIARAELFDLHNQVYFVWE